MTNLILATLLLTLASFAQGQTISYQQQQQQQHHQQQRQKQLQQAQRESGLKTMSFKMPKKVDVYLSVAEIKTLEFFDVSDADLTVCHRPELDGVIDVRRTSFAKIGNVPYKILSASCAGYDGGISITLENQQFRRSILFHYSSTGSKFILNGPEAASELSSSIREFYE